MKITQLAHLALTALEPHKTNLPQFEMSPPCIELIMPSSKNYTERKRLWGRYGPLGEVIEEIQNPDGPYSLIVIFDAKIVLEFCIDSGLLTAGEMAEIKTKLLLIIAKTKHRQSISKT